MIVFMEIPRIGKPLEIGNRQAAASDCHSLPLRWEERGGTLKLDGGGGCTALTIIKALTCTSKWEQGWVLVFFFFLT